MDTFYADVLTYAAVAGHELGQRVRALFPLEPPQISGSTAGIGSVLLLAELLTKPLRHRSEDELAALGLLLGRLDLLAVDRATAKLATALGAAYGLRAADVLHLATAIGAARDRFITNNKADFPKRISEIGVTYREDLHALHQRRAFTIVPEARSNVQNSTGHCNQATNYAIRNSMPRSTSEPSTVTGVLLHVLSS